MVIRGTTNYGDAGQRAANYNRNVRCPDCGKLIVNRSARCMPCAQAMRRKVNGQVARLLALAEKRRAAMEAR